MSIIHRTRKLIVIEGTDKETQTRLLEEKLSSEVRGGIFTRSFPRYHKPTGRRIKKYEDKKPNLLIEYAALLYTYDRFSAKKNMIDNLESGSNMLCNGYTESTMAHYWKRLSNSKQRTEFIEWLENMEYEDFEMPRPDAVIFLNMPNETDTYIELANKYNWTQIECTPDKERILNEELLEHIRKILEIP